MDPECRRRHQSYFAVLRLKVRRVEAGEEEEWLTRVSVFDELYCLISQQVCCVAVFSYGLSISLPVVTAAMDMIPIADATGDMTIEVVKSS